MPKKPLTQAQAVNELRRVFSTFNLTAPFGAEEIVVAEDFVLLGSRNDRLAAALFDFAFPRANAGVYYHFTSYNRFKNIVSSGQLRLYNLHRRFGSSEFRTFCRDYNLDGYLRGREGEPEEGYFRELMNDLFYVSFVADPNAHADRLWKTFANEHQGVRLAFEVKLLGDYANFRQVAYQNDARVSILKALQNTFAPYGRHFVSLGLSRMGGFYQRTDFSYQTEHRLLVKRIPNERFQFQVHPVAGEHYKFIECSLQNRSCTAFEVKLVEVVVGRRCGVEKAQRYIREMSTFPDLKVTAANTL